MLNKLIFMAIAAVFCLSPALGQSILESRDEAADLNLAWNVTNEQLQMLVPGIQCELSNTPRLGSAGSFAELVEAKLSPMFPDVQCYGELDMVAMQALVEKDVFSNSAREARDHTFGRRNSDARIEQERGRKVQEVKSDETKDNQSCSGAKNPGNCRVCVVARAGQAVGEIGVCAAVAYGAAAATAGTITPIAWAGFISCGIAAVSKAGYDMTVCWTR